LLCDRREHFSTSEDVRQIVRILADERCRREIDPTRSLLRDVLMQKPASDTDCHGLLEVITLLTGWMDDVRYTLDERLIALLKLGGRWRRPTAPRIS